MRNASKQMENNEKPFTANGAQHENPSQPMRHNKKNLQSKRRTLRNPSQLMGTIRNPSQLMGDNKKALQRKRRTMRNPSRLMGRHRFAFDGNRSVGKTVCLACRMSCVRIPLVTRWLNMSWYFHCQKLSTDPQIFYVLD